jgi:predicted transcriptional regulator
MSGHAGSVIRIFRDVTGMTQGDLARRSSVSRSTLGRIERGQADPTSSEMHTITSAVVDYLLEPVVA